MSQIVPRPASAAEAGRACPYCRFALKEGAAVVQCGACHAVHHEECFTDNGGCAIMGCAGAATSAASPAAATPPPPPPTATYATAPPPPPPPSYAAPTAPGGSGPGRSNTALILAVLVLALAVAGGAAALVLSSDKRTPSAKANPSAATVTQVVTPDTTTEAPTTTEPDLGDETTPTTEREPDTETTADTGSTGVLPDESDDQMADDIASVLLSHHEAIVRHDFRSAWVLTSQRYRAKKLREPGGYGAWETAQSSLSRYLDPSGLHVAVLDTNDQSGVATIRVTGMGWSAPRSSCSSWEGVTWAKYEGGHWRYEPGYSISDQRRAMWQPRRDELLGWGC